MLAGRIDEAASWAERALREKPNWGAILRLAAASNALAGRLDRAQMAMTRLREIDPAFRISDLKDLAPVVRRPEYLARLEDGLRKAGLPE